MPLSSCVGIKQEGQTLMKFSVKKMALLSVLAVMVFTARTEAFAQGNLYLANHGNTPVLLAENHHHDGDAKHHHDADAKHHHDADPSHHHDNDKSHKHSSNPADHHDADPSHHHDANKDHHHDADASHHHDAKSDHHHH
jgi:hypothetical protein